MQPNEATARLKQLGYLTRQNQQAAPLFLNLGGSKSEANAPDFKGLVLLSPVENLILGASPSTILAFRELVMTHLGDQDWVRRAGVPGPPSGPHRVEVRIVHADTNPQIACETASGRHLIDSYAEKLEYSSSDGYRWGEIQRFLVNLDMFCVSGAPE